MPASGGLLSYASMNDCKSYFKRTYLSICNRFKRSTKETTRHFDARANLILTLTPELPDNYLHMTPAIYFIVLE